MNLSLTSGSPRSITALAALAFASLVSFAAHAFPVSDQGNGTFKNPVIWADVPDPCVTRVGDTYYMVSTTMHLAPGIPVMKSKDLVNWELVSYCYSEIDRGDAYSLKNGKNDYANGSWASNIRYDQKLKRFFVINACNTMNKSEIFSTDDPEKGQWRCDIVDKCYDPGLLLDGDRRYVIYGQRGHHYREIFVNPKTFEVTLGPEKFWKKPMSFDGHDNMVEGAHSYKRGEYIYLPVIELRERRVESVWRGKDINDPASWEARKIFSGDIRDKSGNVVLPFTGIAQGGFVDTPDGKTYAMFFQDYGAVGRIPVLIPVKWTDDGWPILGNNGQSVDEVLPIHGKPQKLKTDIVESDEFDNGPTRHIFSDKEVGTGITAGLSVEKINELLKKTAAAGNLITNGDFENADSSMWTVNGGGGLGILTIEQEAGGNHVMKVSQRQATIAGPLQKLAGKLEPGATYRVSVRVRYDDYADVAGQKITTVPERDFKVTMLLGGKFGDVAIQRVPKGQWTVIISSYTVPANANVADAALFFETTWVPTGEFSEAENKVKHTFDFSADDVTLTKDGFSDIIAQNEFGYNDSNLKLQWQWNHNPNNNLWSLTDRKGWLRLKSGLRSNTIRDARNTLTQRTFGPTSSGCTAIDVTNMRDGDVAGLSAFQNQYGFVGVKMEGGRKSLVMQRAQKKDDAAGLVVEAIPLKQDVVFLKVDCDFGADKKDQAYFYYSLDGKVWQKIGDTLHMFYDWPDFVGYRFGLFYYSTGQIGGWVDFDYFRVIANSAQATNALYGIGKNPIFRDAFTADPAPLVVGDTLYLYVGHDDAHGDELFTMPEWLCYSTKDMKHWTAHGPIMKPADFKWSDGSKAAWASQVVEKGGKFFFYVTVKHDSAHPGDAIGVAVADQPIGPFKDARGTALVYNEMTYNPVGAWGDIDPTVFIDDGGTPWMSWGNGTCYLAKLKPNMIEIDGKIETIELPNYTEGPWLHKRKNLYYLTYAAFAHQGTAEKICYATAPKITGPWTYRGILTGFAQNSYTIHPGIVEFKGQSYLFYHNATLTLNGEAGATGRRSVCVEYLFYNPDGTMKPVEQTVEGVSVPPVPEPPAPNHWKSAPPPPMGWNSWDCFGTALAMDDYRLSLVDD